MSVISSGTIQLIVTSPPYPMIEMWDEAFSQQSSEILNALSSEDGTKAFELMHQELDKTWEECNRVLRDGGFLCINIGDATRTINDFQLYSNHARILQKLMQLGFQILPEVLWRKQTNAPNKFMGSGMLPAGAYVTLEHEYILIARKGGKRIFKSAKEKLNRQESGYFWEERNIWFSDIWDFKGITQKLHNDQLREKSAAFPFELAYRLVSMYSVKNDTVLDPFAGTGTTILASMLVERNSIGIELQEKFNGLIKDRIMSARDYLNEFVNERLVNHKNFIEKRLQEKKDIKYTNAYYNFPVVTKQEENIIIRTITEIIMINKNEYEVSYEQKKTKR